MKSVYGFSKVRETKNKVVYRCERIETDLYMPKDEFPEGIPESLEVTIEEGK